jgi:hypothetical protein
MPQADGSQRITPVSICTCVLPEPSLLARMSINKAFARAEIPTAPPLTALEE